MANLAVLEFSANLVPGFGTIDATQQGHYGDAALSALADIASLVSFGAGELYAAGRIGAKSARLAHTFAIGVDSATAGVRIVQSIITGLNGDAAGAAAGAGEVLLRLIGVKLSAAELKALKSASIKPELPPPGAGNRPRYTWPGHRNAAIAEEELAKIVHLQPDQAVIHWGDVIGTHHADVVSVNVKTGEVTLWDAKYRSRGDRLRPSETFTNQNPA